MYWGQCQSLCFNFFYRWLLDVTILMILSCTISSLWEVQKRCYINTQLKWSSHALMYCKSLKMSLTLLQFHNALNVEIMQTHNYNWNSTMQLRTSESTSRRLCLQGIFFRRNSFSNWSWNKLPRMWPTKWMKRTWEWRRSCRRTWWNSFSPN